jgi:DNA-binding XRE family transcriptional regulator
MSVQFIGKDGVPQFAVLPFAEYESLVSIAEDKLDAAAVIAFRESEEETFPEEVLDALLNGDSPIKVYRTYRKMTQDSLAKAIGKSLAYIAKLEAGERKGTVDVLSDIADTLGISLEQLI